MYLDKKFVGRSTTVWKDTPFWGEDWPVACVEYTAFSDQPVVLFLVLALLLCNCGKKQTKAKKRTRKSS